MDVRVQWSARKWGPQFSSLQGAKFCKQYAELESRSSPSQTSDKITALTENIIAATETLKQRNQLSCAQIPDPPKL